MTTILERQDFTFEENPGFGTYGALAEATISLSVGETYTVDWNGTIYSNLTAVFYETMNGIGIGNAALLGLEPDSSEPFAIGVADGMIAMFTTENVGTIPVAIYQGAAVETDDTEYLIQGSTLKAIAEAIRAKTGKSDPIPVPDMAAEIGSITGGGSGGSSADVCYVIFKNHDGTVEYGKKAVAVGDDCADPIKRGLFSTPTRESDVQYNYTFYGWATSPNGAADANWYKSIAEDKTVSANFVSALRYYTVTYYDGTTVLKTESLAYGTMPNYVASKEGYRMTGWQPELTAVVGNASYYAQFEKLSGFVRVAQVSSSYVRKAAVNNAGSLLALAALTGQQNNAPVYNIAGDTPVELACSSTSQLYLGDVAFSRDDTELTAQGQNKSGSNTRKVYDVSNPSVLAYKDYKTGGSASSPVAYSPVADIRGNFGSGKIYQTNTVDGTSATTITTSDGGVGMSMVYSPDGIHVAVASTRAVGVFDVASGEQSFAISRTDAKKVSYNVDGNLLAVSYEAAPWVEIYETTNFTKICDLANAATTTCYAELVGAGILVVGTGTAVQVYNITDSGLSDFEQPVPTYEGSTINWINKNHSNTRVVLTSSSAAEVWKLL